VSELHDQRAGDPAVGILDAAAQRRHRRPDRLAEQEGRRSAGLTPQRRPPFTPRRDIDMPDYVARTPRASAPPPMPPLLMPTPPVAPLLPPVHAVDLMIEAGSAAFGAVWRGKEAKIIEIPALTDSMPEFKTTYDIDPHAEARGFDD